MNRRAGSVLRLATPVKAWTQRFALLLLLSAAVALMVLGKSESQGLERVRMALSDAVAPVLGVLSQPVSAFNDAVEGFHQWLSVGAENAVLREQNTRLEHWQTVARRLEAENRALRQLLQVAPDPGLSFVTARVIGDQGGAFVRSVLVNAGAEQGIARGQAAMTGEGLVGRVAETGQNAARVILVTDINSRIPVLVGEGRDRAVLAGDNTSQPVLLYLGRRHKVKPGDRVVTSGHGGVFPPDLPIGAVTADGDGGMRVLPFVDWSHLEFLRIADFEMPGILNGFYEEQKTDPRRADSGRADSGRADSGRADSGRADSGRTGLSRTDPRR